MIWACAGLGGLVCALLVTHVWIIRIYTRREELWAQKVMSKTYLDYALHAPTASATIERGEIRHTEEDAVREMIPSVPAEDLVRM